MQALLSIMDEIAEYQSVKDACAKHSGVIQVVGAVPSQVSHLTYGLSRDVTHTLIVVSGELKAKQLYEEYRMLDKAACMYPAKDLLFYHADIKGKVLLQKRMEVIRNLVEGKSSSIIVSMDAFMDQLALIRLGLNINRKLIKIANGLLQF